MCHVVSIDRVFPEKEYFQKKRIFPEKKKMDFPLPSSKNLRSQLPPLPLPGPPQTCTPTVRCHRPGNPPEAT